MDTISPYRIRTTKSFDENELKKGLYLVILHTLRTPPHIGIICGGTYHSLSIKGRETEQPLEILSKNIRIRKIPSLFIKIKKHPTFSDDYLKEQFILSLMPFEKVAIGKATCLSPLKLFFEENYNFSTESIHYIFELLTKLEKLCLIENISSLFTTTEFDLPVYNMAMIYSGIENAEEAVSKIKQKNHINIIHS